MGGFREQFKVLICNAIIVLCAVASIVTLCVGTFWKADVTVGADKKTLLKLAGMENGKEQASNAGEESEGSSDDFDMATVLENLPDDFSVSVGVMMDVKGTDMLNAVAGNTQAVSDVLSRTLNDVIDRLEAKVDELMSTFISTAVDVAVDKAMREFIKSISQALGRDDLSEEEISERLQSEYGVTTEDVAQFKKDIKTAAGALLDGDSDGVKNLLGTSEVLYAMMKIIAKEDLEGSKREGEEVTEEQIEEKATAMRNDLVNNYEEAIKKFQNEAGTLTKASVLMGLLALVSGEDPEKAENREMTEEDVREFLMGKINEALGEDTMQTMTKYLGYVGYFLIVVIAAWAYIILKILIKLFMANKSVSMFAPRFFGWMPHVFLVGLPMTIVKLAQATPEIMKNAGMTEETYNNVKSFIDMINVNVSSLTWVSAAATVVLLVLSFFYGPLRKELKVKSRRGD